MKLRHPFVGNLAGAIAVEASSALKAVAHHAKRTAFSSMKFEHGTAPHYWFMLWLDSTRVLEKSRDVVAEESPKGPAKEYDSWQEREDSKGVPSDIPTSVFAPGAGHHIFRYRGRPYWLTKSKNADKASGYDYTLHTPGTSLTPLSRIVEEGRELALIQKKDKLQVYILHEGYSDAKWVLGTEHMKRPASSVVLPDGQMESLQNDIRRFLSSKTIYQNRAIPYQRGYLCYGPPGGGKTSLILSLASEFGMSVYFLQLDGSVGINNRVIAELLAKVPGGNIILIEDVDATNFSVQDRREDEDQGEGRGAIKIKTQSTLSGILNALDGALASPGRLLFMTTNHIEKLDPALIRDGRVDYRLYIGPAQASQAERLFMRFFPEADPNDALAFGHMAEQKEMMMASIQGCLIKADENPKKALELVHEWKTPEQ